jgi:hypothetical protein
MKLFSIILTLIATATLSLSAHPGRTDSNGGHWCTKTGTYHYHAFPESDTDALRNKSEANTSSQVGKASVKPQNKATEKAAG